MLTREEILSSYKKVNYPEKLFDKSVKEVKNIIFYGESIEPNSQKEKDTKKLSQSYVLPWRLVQKNYPDASNNTFSRGGNFAKKEPLIDIKFDNFKLIYDRYSLPIETGIIYLKNNHGGANGPYNLEQIKNLSKNKKLDSTYEFRLIDIFSFKDSELFSFQSVKIINDEKWIDLIIDSPLLKYNELYKNVNEEKQIEVKKEEKKDNEIKEEKKEEKQIEDKNEEKQNEIKDEDKKENKKEDKKEDKKITQAKRENEGKWEVVVKKKKSNKEKEEEEENSEIIGLKPKNSKEGKKGKKKKKAQFEDTNFELGFQIK